MRAVALAVDHENIVVTVSVKITHEGIDALPRVGFSEGKVRGGIDKDSAEITLVHKQPVRLPIAHFGHEEVGIPIAGYVAEGRHVCIVGVQHVKDVPIPVREYEFARGRIEFVDQEKILAPSGVVSENDVAVSVAIGCIDAVEVYIPDAVETGHSGALLFGTDHRVL